MHIVLDGTAMTAAGQGNILASRLIHRAHCESNWFLYARRGRLSKPTAPAPGRRTTSPACPGSASWTLTWPPR